MVVREDAGAWLEDETGDVDGLTRRDGGRRCGKDLGGHAGRKHRECNRPSGRGDLLTEGYRAYPAHHEPRDERCNAGGKPKGESVHVWFSILGRWNTTRRELVSQRRIDNTISSSEVKRHGSVALQFTAASVRGS